MSLRILSLADVKQSITMLQAIDAMERAFIQLASNQVKMPLRTGISIEQASATTLTMPGYLEKDKALGLKVVSIFPNNIEKNKPVITGFIMLLDASTGEPKALMDAAYLTALRTGAVSGLATKYFAKDDAKQVAILGSGVQAATQLEAVAAVRSIEKVSIWSRNKAKAEKFAKTLPINCEHEVYSNVASAVKNADIICTATSSQEPLVFLDYLKPDAHINAIGSHAKAMKEIADDAMGSSVVIVDQLEAALNESGEVISAVESNFLQKENIIELGKWLLDKQPDYKSVLTVFKSVGLALQDLSVAENVYQRAVENNLGSLFNLS